MLFGKTRISSKEFARTFVSRVLAALGKQANRPPCNRLAKKRKWTNKVRMVLRDLGNESNYDDCYPWLLDFVWWDKQSQSLILAVESEWRQPKAEEDDFQKLVVFKCPLKLYVFSGDPNRTKNMAEKYLKEFGQHVKGENYVLIGFTPLGPRSFFFKVRQNGRLRRPVRFKEWKGLHYDKTRIR